MSNLKSYTVEVYREVEHYYEVYVEAESEEAACEKALSEGYLNRSDLCEESLTYEEAKAEELTE